MLWNSSLETGILEIDNQHKELFNRIDAVLNAGMNGEGHTKIKETIDFLKDYVVIHFRDEERLHSQSKYPESSSHKLMHEKYVMELNKLIQDYEKEGNTLNIIISINKSVVDWLVKHINVHDKKFSAYYKSI